MDNISTSDSQNPDLNLIRQAALRLLTRRDYATLELQQRLRAKGFTLNAIQSLLQELTQSGLLSDARFTENYIYRRGAKGYGPQKIALELHARGISNEMIAQYLNITDNAWFVSIRKVWLKHFKGQLPKNFEHKAKQMRFLQYRGYTREQINSVLTSTLEDWD